jgi:glycosyltransferase involved in cell wall biosynthesis
MKLATVSTAQIPSTTANSIQVMKVCQALVQLGHALRLYVPGQGPFDWAELADLYGLTSQFEIERIPANPALKRNDFAWAAARRARAWKADLVYSWTIQAAVFALLGGQPALYEAHDLPTGRLGPLWLRAFLGLAGKKRLVMITRALQQALERRFGHLLPPSQLVIAPNGLDLDRYQGLPGPAKARRWLDLPEALTVGCTGHLYAGRGGDLFLGLAGNIHALSFVWVGGREEDVLAYRARAVDAGLNNVTFTGFIPNARLPLYQAAADILLMPYARSIAGSSGGNSADICSPMKLFDYLGAGRAILTSDLPVIREVLDESNAVFAAPEDLAAWTQALARLCGDEQLRERLSARSRELAQDYTWLERERKCLEGL